MKNTSAITYIHLHYISPDSSELSHHTRLSLRVPIKDLKYLKQGKVWLE